MNPIEQQWSDFLDAEGLAFLGLDQLIRGLAMTGPPRTFTPTQTYFARCRVARFAMALGIDLSGMYTERGRMGMKDKMLAAWLDVYREKFGSTHGTAAELEQKTRAIRKRVKK